MEFVYLADRLDAVPLVAEWYFTQWGYLNDISSLEKTIQLLQEYLNRTKLPLIILAIENENILGAVQLKTYEPTICPEKEHWLGGVYVAAHHRKKKIGEKLVKKAIEIAKAKNVSSLFLQTQKMDGGLYKRLGWIPITRTVKHGEKTLVMKKDL